MHQLTIADRTITQDGEAFVIAEIGHNHGGDLETALRMCTAAKSCGCDAVKFQKRTIDRCFTKAYLNTPYNSEHAFGATYGEHRRALEFNWYQYQTIMEHCENIGIICFATAFDENAVDFLEECQVPAYKVASGDLTNLPLIGRIIMTGKPAIVSTGGADMSDIMRAHERLAGYPAAFMHCVARYPCPADHCNLRAISTMMEKMPNRIIGYSSHFNGPLSARDSYYYGARIVEQHFTLDRTSKGSDHAMSLEPKGMRELVSDLRLISEMAGNGQKRRTKEETKALEKMAKCIWPSRTLGAGHIIEEQDIVVRTPAVPGALEPYRRGDLLGRPLIHSASTSAPLRTTDLLTEDNDGESV